MNKIIICVGISGSGKSTWSSNFIAKNSDYFRINRNSIRLGLVGNLDGYYYRKDLNFIEGLVTKLESKMFSTLLHNNLSIIIDNTNLKKSYINMWINGSLDFEHKINFKLFDCDPDLAEFRVLNRDSIIDTDYIKLQFEQYKSIKKHILEYYPDFILNK